MKTNKNRKLKEFLLILIFTVVYSLLYKWWQTGNPFQPSTILFGGITLTLLLIFMNIGRKFFKNVPDRPLNTLKKVIVLRFLLFLVVVFVVSLVVIFLGQYVYFLVMGIDTATLPEEFISVEFPGVVRMYPVMILLASTIFFYMTWSQTIIKEQQLREENLKFRYKTLKTQVNPHFLFNSLNTLSELVYTDSKRADQYIQKLSGIYRYILDNEETDLISLQQEINFVRGYYELQKERQGNKILLNINVNDAAGFRIIPVSLQLLLENSIKHNSMTEQNPLKISIYRENEYIVVENTLQKKTTLEDSPGLGLQNLKERTRLLTGREIVINIGTELYQVKVPVLRS